MAYALRTSGDAEKYILLEDTVGVEENIFSCFEGEMAFQAIKGEIFEKENSKKHGETATEYTFVSTKNPDRSVTCIEEDMKCLKPQEFNLLVAVISKNERMRLLGNPQIFEIEKGDLVSVDVSNKDDIKTMQGKVCYIGPIPDRMGHYFGLQFEVRHIVSNFFVQFQNST